MKICFATNNSNKVEEISKLLGDGYSVVGLGELGIREDIPEEGATLEENSLFKANYVFQRMKVPIIADDTGLEVQALNGEPGVYSARYAGPGKDSLQNILLLLQRLKGKKDRSARFKTIITYIDAQGRKHIFEGIVNGHITETLKGDKGFGYDPIFVPDGYNETFAAMTMEEKNMISHRGIAVRKLVNFLTR